MGFGIGDLLEFPEFRVFQESVIGVERGEDEAIAAVAEALLDDENPEEHGGWAEEHFGEGRAFTGLGVALGHEGRVALEFGGGDFHRVPGILEDMLVQKAEAAVEGLGFVDEFVVVAEFRAIEQLGLAIIRVPAGVLHPMAEEMAFAGDAVGIEARGGQFPVDFGGEFRGAPFVGVDAEDPVVFGGIEGKIAEFAEAGEFFTDDAGVVFAGDFQGAIRAEGIHEDNLVGPLDAFENGADLPGFVQGEGVGRNWICRCHAGGGQLGTEAWSESKFACGDETFNI